MPFLAVKSIALRVWCGFGLEHVFSSDGFFVFRFRDDDGLHAVLQAGPWMFGGKAFILQRWSASFVFNKNSIKMVPVWAKLQGLPLPLWSEEGLSFVASIVGKPVACDKATHEGTRLAYARVCVELTANKAPLHSFDLVTSLTDEPIRVTVEYEWKPKRCHSCQVFGHSCADKREGNKKVEDDQKTTKHNNGKVEEGQTGLEIQEWFPARQKDKGKVGDPTRIEPSHASPIGSMEQSVAPTPTTAIACKKPDSRDNTSLCIREPLNLDKLAIMPYTADSKAETSLLEASATWDEENKAVVVDCAINEEASIPKSLNTFSSETPTAMAEIPSSSHGFEASSSKSPSVNKVDADKTGNKVDADKTGTSGKKNKGKKMA